MSDFKTKYAAERRRAFKLTAPVEASITKSHESPWSRGHDYNTWTEVQLHAGMLVRNLSHDPGYSLSGYEPDGEYKLEALIDRRWTTVTTLTRPKIDADGDWVKDDAPFESERSLLFLPELASETVA